MKLVTYSASKRAPAKIGVIAADGAVEAKVSVIDKDAIEVAIEDARYRLPATIRAPAK